MRTIRSAMDFFLLYLMYLLTLADLFCPCNNRHFISDHVQRSGHGKWTELKANPSCKSESCSWLCSQSSMAGVAIAKEYLLNIHFISHFSHNYIKCSRKRFSNCTAVFKGEV